MGKKALTETEIAALAEGGATVSAAADPAAALAEGVAADPAAALAEGGAADPAVAPLAEGSVADPAAASEPAAPNAVVDYLQGQLKEKDTALVSAQVELSNIKKELDDMKAAHNGLLEIAVKSVSNMQVALGGAAINAAGMSAVQLLAEHKRVSEVFADKFKAGGVAAVDVADPQKKEHAPDALAVARLNAFRNQKSK